MRLGKYVEPFLIAEYERSTGCEVTRRQEEVSLPELPGDVFATIDGMISSQNTVVEMKFLAPYFNREQTFYRYYDQVCLQMMCTGAERGLLVVGQGTNELIEIECIRDAAYEAEFLERIHAWLLCVKTLSPPFPVPPRKPPPERFRTIDLSVDAPNWKDELECLLFVHGNTKPYVEQHEEAGRLAKALVPDDVGAVIAGDYRIARNKKGTLTITRRAA
jgi:hypothetical protein